MLGPHCHARISDGVSNMRKLLGRTMQWRAMLKVDASQAFTSSSLGTNLATTTRIQSVYTRSMVVCDCLCKYVACSQCTFHSRIFKQFNQTCPGGFWTNVLLVSDFIRFPYPLRNLANSRKCPCVRVTCRGAYVIAFWKWRSRHLLYLLLSFEYKQIHHNLLCILPLGHERNCNTCDSSIVLRDLALIRWFLHLTLRGLREAAAILLPSQVTQRMLFCTSVGSNQISVKLSCWKISIDHLRKKIQFRSTFQARSYTKGERNNQISMPSSIHNYSRSSALRAPAKLIHLEGLRRSSCQSTGRDWTTFPDHQTDPAWRPVVPASCVFVCLLSQFENRPCMAYGVSRSQETWEGKRWCDGSRTMANHWLIQLRGSKDTIILVYNYLWNYKSQQRKGDKTHFVPFSSILMLFEHEIFEMPALMLLPCKESKKNPQLAATQFWGAYPIDEYSSPAYGAILPRRRKLYTLNETLTLDTIPSRHDIFIDFRMLHIQIMHSLQNSVSCRLQQARTCHASSLDGGRSSLLQNPRWRPCCLLAPLSISELSCSFRRLAATIVGAKTFWSMEDRLQMDACKRLFDISGAQSSVPSCASISLAPLLVQHQTQVPY